MVPKDSVKIDGSSRRVRAFEGGAISGRARYYSLAWLQQNAEAVALSGAGSRYRRPRFRR